MLQSETEKMEEMKVKPRLVDLDHHEKMQQVMQPLQSGKIKQEASKVEEVHLQ